MPENSSSKIIRNAVVTSIDTGRVYWVNDAGLAETLHDEGMDEGPTCSICDGLGHGYPGGGPCPLEERGWEAARWDEEREMGFR